MMDNFVLLSKAGTSITKIVLFFRLLHILCDLNGVLSMHLPDEIWDRFPCLVAAKSSLRVFWITVYLHSLQYEHREVVCHRH